VCPRSRSVDTLICVVRSSTRGRIRTLTKQPPAYTETDESQRICRPILDLVRLELSVSSAHPAVSRYSYLCVPDPWSCLLEATSISESALETFALVCPDTTAVFPCGNFSRSSVPRIRSEFLSCSVGRKPGMRAAQLAFCGVSWILGLQNEGLSMVCP